VKTILLLILGFVAGFCARGVFVTLEVPWWGSLLVYVPLFLLTLLVSRRLSKKARPPFDVELKAHLRANDYVLATREVAVQAWPIIESPHAPRGKAVIMNSDDLARLTRMAGPETIKAFQEWGDQHRRTSPFLKTCTHEWPPDGDVSHAFTGSPHKCTLGIFVHGPKCVCRCGATAAYVEQPDGSIDKTFEEPKGDGS
jgi:hypothetical protein